MTSYVIESRPSSRSTWTQAGKVKGDQTTFTVPDLRLDTEYLFRVIAVNEKGQSNPLEGKETAKPTKKISKLFFLSPNKGFSIYLIRNLEKFALIDILRFSSIMLSDLRVQ